VLGSIDRLSQQNLLVSPVACSDCAGEALAMRDARNMRHPDTLTLDQLWDAAPAHPVRHFEPAMIEGLPAAAQRLLGNVIEPGVPLYQAIRLHMRGEMKLGSWRPFEAEQVIRWGRGLIWQAKAKFGLVSISGHDAIIDGVGEMRWRLAGIIPVMCADGRDISRSAANRLELEATLLPSALLDEDVQWLPDDDDMVARARVYVGTDVGEINFAVDEEGNLLRAWMTRWGNPDGGDFHEVPFGVFLGEPKGFFGCTISTRIRAGWYFGTPRFDSEGEFFRAQILAAELR
jgi:hypothetical protein